MTFNTQRFVKNSIRFFLQLHSNFSHLIYNYQAEKDTTIPIHRPLISVLQCLPIKKKTLLYLFTGSFSLLDNNYHLEIIITLSEKTRKDSLFYCQYCSCYYYSLYSFFLLIRTTHAMNTPTKTTVVFLKLADWDAWISFVKA